MAAFHCGGGVLIACIILTWNHGIYGFTQVKIPVNGNGTVTWSPDVHSTWKKVGGDSNGNSMDTVLCTVRFNETGVVAANITICISACNHTSLTICNMTATQEGVYSVETEYGGYEGPGESFPVVLQS